MDFQGNDHGTCTLSHLQVVGMTMLKLCEEKTRTLF